MRAEGQTRLPYQMFILRVKTVNSRFSLCPHTEFSCGGTEIVVMVKFAGVNWFKP